MIDVICLAYGEPPQPDFLAQYRYSLSILKRLTSQVASIPGWLLPLISATRARKRCKQQKELNYQTPLESISRAFVKQLESVLSKTTKDPYRVSLIYEFRKPFLINHLKSCEENPPDQIILVPLYLADSTFTSGLSKKDVARYRLQNANASKIPHPVQVPLPASDDHFARIVSRHILAEAQKKGFLREELKNASLVLGAHGTLVEPPEGLDNGLEQTENHIHQVKAELEPVFKSIHYGWLNHKRGGKWTEPDMEDLSRELEQKGEKLIFYYPIGFVADNTETQLEGPLCFASTPVFHTLDCLNLNPEFVDWVASRVLEQAGCKSELKQTAKDRDQAGVVL